MILSPHEAAYLANVVFPNDPVNATIMVAVGIAESGLNTDLISRSTTGANLGQRDHGWMQVSGKWNGDKLVATPDWRDPLINARLARSIWGETKAAGKDPWTAWHVYLTPTTGSFYQYIPDAKIAMAAPFMPVGMPTRLQDLRLVIDALDDLSDDVAEIRAHFA